MANSLTVSGRISSTIVRDEQAERDKAMVSGYVLRASAWASWVYFIVDMDDEESAYDAAEFEIGTDGCSIRRKGGSGTRSRSGGPATRPENQEEIERLLGMAGKASQYAAKVAELERTSRKTRRRQPISKKWYSKVNVRLACSKRNFLRSK
jgi:hypothetical protein